jgi:hypothetical protein
LFLAYYRRRGGSLNRSHAAPKKSLHINKRKKSRAPYDNLRPKVYADGEDRLGLDFFICDSPGHRLAIVTTVVKGKLARFPGKTNWFFPPSIARALEDASARTPRAGIEEKKELL